MSLPLSTPLFSLLFLVRDVSAVACWKKKKRRKKSLTGGQPRPPDRDITQNTHSTSGSWRGGSHDAHSPYFRECVRAGPQWPARCGEKSYRHTRQRCPAHAHTHTHVSYRLRVRAHRLSYKPQDWKILEITRATGNQNLWRSRYLSQIHVWPFLFLLILHKMNPEGEQITQGEQSRSHSL